MFSASVECFAPVGEPVASGAVLGAPPLLVAADAAQVIGRFQAWPVLVELLAVLEFLVDDRGRERLLIVAVLAGHALPFVPPR